MKTIENRIDPEEYILAVLSPQERLGATLRIAREAFEGTSLARGRVSPCSLLADAITRLHDNQSLGDLLAYG